VWYPGAEPGGGGYIAQRMLAAKDETHATGATLFFNIAHYAMRPWPWIIVALCSLIVFPDLASIRQAFPNVDPKIIKNDLAYPAMLTFVPHGLLGLIIAPLLAAYMSTISTHLNWGSSYISNDFYKRFVNPAASEKELVNVGRISTVVLTVLSAGLALMPQNALQAFQILLQVGAGTGLLFILRWFWWRINAVCEIVAMFVSFFVAVYFQFIHARLFPGIPLTGWEQICIGVAITTSISLLTALLTPPADKKTLRNFCRLVNPGGPGWKKIFKEAAADKDPIKTDKQPTNLPAGILCMFVGAVAVYSALFAVGFWLYGNHHYAIPPTVVTGVAAFILIYMWGRVSGAARAK